MASYDSPSRRTAVGADAITVRQPQSRHYESRRWAVRPNSTSSGAQRRRDADAAFDAYVRWREECIAVDRAYSAWTSTGLADAALAFDAYTDALDREERAANTYVRLMRQLGQLVGSGLAPEPRDAPSGH
jgi:hypothetical protein